MIMILIQQRQLSARGPSGIEIVEMTKTERKYQFPPEDMTLYSRMPPEEIKSLVDQYWFSKSP